MSKSYRQLHVAIGANEWFCAEGWALWLLRLGLKEGGTPGAHEAHPYYLYLVVREALWGRRREMRDTERSSEAPLSNALSERTIEPSGQIVLECSACGNRLMLLGLEEDWPKEHRDAFACGGCGKTVTLAHRVDGTAYTIKSLLRRSIRSDP